MKVVEIKATIYHTRLFLLAFPTTQHKTRRDRTHRWAALPSATWLITLEPIRIISNWQRSSRGEISHRTRLVQWPMIKPSKIELCFRMLSIRLRKITGGKKPLKISKKRSCNRRSSFLRCSCKRWKNVKLIRGICMTSSSMLSKRVVWAKVAIYKLPRATCAEIIPHYITQVAKTWVARVVACLARKPLKACRGGMLNRFSSDQTSLKPNLRIKKLS